MITLTILFSEGTVVEYKAQAMDIDKAYRDAWEYAKRIANGREILSIC